MAFEAKMRLAQLRVDGIRGSPEIESLLVQPAWGLALRELTEEASHDTEYTYYATATARHPAD